MYSNRFHKRLPRRLQLGKHYVIWFNPNHKMMCKFIQPTKCGFNFLKLDTNKCIIKQHLYPSKCENHLSGDWFWVNDNMKIDECK